MRFDHPTPEQIPQLRLLWKEAFGDEDAFLDVFFTRAFSEKRSLCATENGILLGALYWMDCTAYGRKYAYLYAVATQASHRGQGVNRALMEKTHALLEAQGYAGAILVPAPGLASLYERYGYRYFGGRDCLRVEGEDAPVAVRQLSENQYAKLRRTYLEDGAVLQEGESLSLLSTQCAFYAGEDFLLTATVKEGVLHGAELLGNPEDLGKVLTALGAKSGEVFVPGATPFAMCLPFGSAKIPTYFAFAFA